MLRVYKNAAGDVLRTDSITWTATTNTFNSGTLPRTYARHVDYRLTVDSDVADRTVAVISLVTNAETVDATYYNFVTWTRNNQTVYGNMSDLPTVSDSV